MFEDTVMIGENENDQGEDDRRCDCLCYIVQFFAIFGLIFVLVYFIWFLFRMIDTMTFKMKYD